MKRIYTLFAVLLFLLPVLPLAGQSTNPEDWVFDKGKYNTNMVLTAVVNIEGKESRDTSDRVAAFVGNEVRGVGKPVYVPELDRYLVSLFVYGSGSPSQVTFLVYDAGTQRVLPVLDTLTFQEDPLGSPANPFVLRTVQIDITFAKDDVFCAADNYGWAKAQVSGGKQPYFYKWSTGAVTDSIGRLSAGRYYLTLTDGNGIEKIDSVDIKNLQIDVAEPILRAAPDTAVCRGTDAFIFAYSTQAGSPIRYNWYDLLNRPISGNTIVALPNLVTPTLVYAETEVRGCRSSRVPFTINILPTPSATFSVTERVSRVGQELGFFAGDISNQYAYNWSFGDGNTSNRSLASHVYTLPGFYDVRLEVSSRGGCSDVHVKTIRVEEESTIIIEDNDLIVLLDVTNVACEADETGVIRAQVLEGTPPFSYRWSNGETGSSIRRLRAGRYTLTVTDSKGLGITAEANVEVENEEIPLPQVIVNSGRSICVGEDVLLVASAEVSGAGFYWYPEAEGGELLHTGNQFLVRNLQAPVIYYVETRLGACASSERLAVELRPRRPELSFTVSAFRLQLGESLRVSVDRPVAQNRYFWDFGNGRRDTTAAPLVYQYPQAGEYRLSLTVEEPGGCRDTREVTILVVTEGLSLFFEVEHPNCPDDASGIIIAQVIGGQTPYTYQWSTGQRVAALNGLRAGAYRLTVTDAGGRSVSGNVVLNSRIQEIPAAQVVVNGGQPYCPGDDILLTAFAPGLAGAEFYWYDGSNPSRLLYAGSPLIQFAVGENRSFLVETRLGACTAATRTLVEVPVSGPDAAFDVTARRVSPETEIEFTPRAIDSDNNYLWDFGDGTRSTVPVSTHAYAEAGTYIVTLTVTDPNGCSSESSLTIEVDAPGVLFSAFEVTDVNCVNDREGAVLVNAINGVAPYTYQWSNGQTGNSLSGLARGKYYLTITDAAGQRLVDSVEVKSRVGEVLPASAVSAAGDTVCVGREVLLLAYSQQSGPLSFYWYDAPQGGNLIQQTNQLQISSLKEDRELFLETRIGNCIAPSRTPVRVWVDNPNQGFSVDERFVLMGSPVRFIPVVNDPRNQYQWFFGDGGNGREPEATHVYEQPGSYDVQLIVISPRGCVGLSSSESLVTVLADTDFTATLDIQQVSCAGKTDGRIRAQAFNGTAPYSFLWSNGATTAQITNLGEGSFQVTVTDAGGRSIVRSGEVRSTGRAPATPAITVVNSGPLCAGSPVSLTAFSGGAVEGYYWFDQAGGLVFVGSTFSINELAGNVTYNVEARLSGCVSERAAIRLEPKAPDASFQVDLSTVLLGEQVRFTPADTTLKEYRWTFGDGSSSTARFPIHSYGREGLYDVSLTVLDPDGCRQTKNSVGLVRALERSSVGVNAQTRPVLCDADNTGLATLQAIGGVPPYRYQWSNGSTDQQRSGLPAGMYPFTITDSRGARRIDSVRIENLNAIIPAPQVEINGNRPVCAGASVMLLAGNTAYPEATMRWYSSADSDTPQGNSKLLPLGLVARDTVLFLQADVNGCLSERRSVTVRVQRPEAAFSVEPRRQLKEGDLVQFRPTMERADHKYYWSFGDGGWSRAMKPFYFYNVAGNFDVMLRVTDADGCSNVVQQTGFIQVEPSKSGFAGTEGGAVEIRSTRATRLGAFPNPFSEQLTIVFQVPEAGEYHLILRDMMGRALWQQQVDAQAEQIEQISLETTPAQLPEGLYLITVETAGGVVKAVNKVLKTSH